MIRCCSADFPAVQIFEALGTPDDSMWAGVERLQYYRRDFPRWQAKDWGRLVPRLARDPLGVDLLASMLSYNPENRITAGQALKHPWFNDIRRNEARDVTAAAGPSSQRQMLPLAGLGSSSYMPVARSLAGGLSALQPQLPHVQTQQHFQQTLQHQHQLQTGPQQQSSYVYGQHAGMAGESLGTAAHWANMPMSVLQPATTRGLQQQPPRHQPIPA